jgi:hypothetical protein
MQKLDPLYSLNPEYYGTDFFETRTISTQRRIHEIDKKIDAIENPNFISKLSAVASLRLLDSTDKTTYPVKVMAASGITVAAIAALATASAPIAIAAGIGMSFSHAMGMIATDPKDFNKYPQKPSSLADIKHSIKNLFGVELDADIRNPETTKLLEQKQYHLENLATRQYHTQTPVDELASIFKNANIDPASLNIEKLSDQQQIQLLNNISKDMAITQSIALEGRSKPTEFIKATEFAKENFTTPSSEDTLAYLQDHIREVSGQSLQQKFNAAIPEMGVVEPNQSAKPF